ncbi:site-specific recombinase XerD [Winogradskyella epiphytica]|uniref:Site-specific recombinase XerD n=1 Tax=Winogradskyella epiphytica TaxID=262005 RepID=A0A2V4XJJ2_9FLAO|nr:phage integrase SAM-like domain-containing protein [Winogradskyella epiphytica]PYE83500.1 site-specific recombinase XerD [Winogradskyella epiphytica]GGW58625.1 transposase [Winogradskyella epiphytica]
MASLKYFTKGNQNPTTIYLRFTHGRKIDLKRSTSLLINPKYWNTQKGSVKQIAGFVNKKNLQNDLNNLETTILNSFNDHYSSGGIINSEWLNKTIKQYFNQNDNTDLNYLLDYAKQYKENLDTKVLNTGNTGVTDNTKKRYNTIINKVSAFESYQKRRYTFESVDLKFYNDFKNYLSKVEKLNLNTTGRYINYIKTLCLDAKKHGIKINPSVLNGEFRATKEKVNFITLSETEIQTIFKHDFTETPYLENARNWLIIGVWTGARVSDLLKFTKDNIHNGFIEYTAKKTNQKIILPLHPQVKEILENNKGEFPREISSQRFNDYIKKVCELAGINEMVKGSKSKKLKKKVWRKVKGEFSKHELVSSHICRRSFATNHYGKLPTPVLMAITGHKTERVFLNYINKTANDNANTLNEFWQLQEQKKQQKPILDIVKTETA